MIAVKKIFGDEMNIEEIVKRLYYERQEKIENILRERIKKMFSVELKTVEDVLEFQKKHELTLEQTKENDFFGNIIRENFNFKIDGVIYDVITIDYLWMK